MESFLLSSMLLAVMVHKICLIFLGKYAISDYYYKKTSALSHAKKGIYKYGNIVEKQGVTV